MSTSPPPGANPNDQMQRLAAAAAAKDSAARAFWLSIVKEITRQVTKQIDAVTGRSPEVDTIQFPIGQGAPGLVTSVIVGFPCRIIGYTMESVAGGVATVTVARSKPLDHPVMDSLPGPPENYPALNGFYAPGDVTNWVSVVLERDDMLHFFRMSESTLADGIFALHVRRME